MTLRHKSPRILLFPLVVFFSIAFLAAASTAILAEDEVPIPIPQVLSKYQSAIEAHMDYLTEHSRDELGDESTAMWLATIDIRTNWLPKERLPKRLRWHRQVTSPAGSNLYWDQPSIVAAYELAERTGCACYEDAADAYLRDFLDRCVAEPSGLFDWGHHRYYDVESDKVVEFSGGYHECRPYTPAWETFWAVDSQATERAIRAMGAAHIKDPATGMFCRHADVHVRPGVFTSSEIENAKPSLESGAALIESLCWLARKTDDRDGELTQSALRVAQYSYGMRDPETQLIRNRPIDKGADRLASSTEVGLWAGSLLRAAEYTGNGEFQEMADATMTSWLRYGFDGRAGKYFGRLSVQTGEPMVPENPRGHTPPMHAEVFDSHQRPTHNYPLPMAEACLSLYVKTNGDRYRQAVERWTEQIRQSLPANEGRGGYAEDYGRVIHFLVRAADVFESDEYRQLAETVADEAMEQLYVPRMGMFRSHPGEDRCDAVDGPGILILALMYLDGGELPGSAFGF